MSEHIPERGGGGGMCDCEFDEYEEGDGVPDTGWMGGGCMSRDLCWETDEDGNRRSLSDGPVHGSHSEFT